MQKPEFFKIVILLKNVYMHIKKIHRYVKILHFAKSRKSNFSMIFLCDSKQHLYHKIKIIFSKKHMQNMCHSPLRLETSTNVCNAIHVDNRCCRA